MPLLSVPAIYDGEQVRLLEAVPLDGPYRVLVTFVEPVNGQGAAPGDQTSLNALDASFGAWRDERPIEDTLRDIHEARRSRTAPPGV